MAYYWTCPHCGSNLDPGERCDCLKGLKKPFRGEEMKMRKGLTNHISYYTPKKGGLSNEIKY